MIFCVLVNVGRMVFFGVALSRTFLLTRGVLIGVISFLFRDVMDRSSSAR